MKPSSSLRTTFLAVLCLPLATPDLAAQDLVAIRAGKAWTVSGGVIENAVILVRDGRIEAVGADLEVPWNAKVIDARDKVVLPTWILAHSAGGLGGGNNERMQNVPFLTVADGLDPSALSIEEGRRNGVGVANVMPGNNTLVAGRGLIARYTGRTVEEMTLRERSGLKLSLAAGQGNVIAQIREMRRVLDDAAALKKDLDRKREEWQKAKDAGAIKPEEEWKDQVVPWLAGQLVKRWDGNWSMTHRLEVVSGIRPALPAEFPSPEVKRMIEELERKEQS